MRARAIMVLGTSSHVGKSLLTAALCRIFSDEGVRVAPFKSQNMSLNSAATVENLEIGRAAGAPGRGRSHPRFRPYESNPPETCWQHDVPGGGSRQDMGQALCR